MSSTKVALFIARKDIFQDKRLFVMIVVAVIFGIGIQVPNVANLDGSTATILDRTVNVMSGHISISPGNESSAIGNVTTLVNELENISWVEGCLPRTYIPAIIEGDGTAGGYSTGLDLIGMIPSREEKYSKLDTYLVEGRFIEDSDGDIYNGPGMGNVSGSDGGKNVTVLGDELAIKLGVGIGDTINLSLPNYQWSLRIVGIVNIGIGGVDERAIFTHKASIDRLLGFNDSATEILVRTDDPFGVDPRVSSLRYEYPGLTVQSWQEKMSYVDDITDANETLKLISQGMTLVGVMVPVSVLMYVNVKARRREIGILLATGANPGDIFRIFLFETLIIASIGVIGGIALGAGLSLYYMAYPVVNRPNFVVKPLLKLSTFILPAVVIFFATILAGIYPAVKASNVDPVQAIWKE
jgi:ABC-type lipoprotein release transport system permease subunit